MKVLKGNDEQTLKRAEDEFAIQMYFSSHPNVTRMLGFSVTRSPALAVGIQEQV